MNEKAIVERLNAKYGIAAGSTPMQATAVQTKSACVCGRLMHHAVKRGKRKNAKWLTNTQQPQ